MVYLMRNKSKTKSTFFSHCLLPQVPSLNNNIGMVACTYFIRYFVIIIGQLITTNLDFPKRFQLFVSSLKLTDILKEDVKYHCTITELKSYQM